MKECGFPDIRKEQAACIITMEICTLVLVKRISASEKANILGKTVINTKDNGTMTKKTVTEY